MPMCKYDFCLYQTDDWHVMVAHYVKHPGVIPCTEEGCFAVVSSKDNLTRHLKIHKADIVKRYKCSVCPTIYLRKDNAQRHVGKRCRFGGVLLEVIPMAVVGGDDAGVDTEMAEADAVVDKVADGMDAKEAVTEPVGADTVVDDKVEVSAEVQGVVEEEPEIGEAVKAVLDFYRIPLSPLHDLGARSLPPVARYDVQVPAAVSSGMYFVLISLENTCLLVC